MGISRLRHEGNVTGSEVCCLLDDLYTLSVLDRRKLLLSISFALIDLSKGWRGGRDQGREVCVAV